MMMMPFCGTEKVTEVGKHHIKEGYPDYPWPYIIKIRKKDGDRRKVMKGKIYGREHG